ncbi:MAG: heme ABC transporter ATP-binding protein [Ferruginibacter sp.]
MLKATGIHYSIGRNVILTGINVSFNPGEFNIILGPNGSGKSTFMKIFSGEITDQEGEIFYDKQNIRSVKKDVLAKQRAVMSQQPELNFPLSVYEVVMMGRYPHFDFNPDKKDMAICAEVMQLMNLNSFKDRNYLTLSGGEKQRVQFARALAQVWEKPSEGYRYLFLDEPLNSLDINYQQEFLQLARSFADNNTVLIAVLHDINLAIHYGHRLFFLKDGRLITSGKPADIITETMIENVFGLRTRVIKNPVTGLPLMIY